MDNVLETTPIKNEEAITLIPVAVLRRVKSKKRVAKSIKHSETSPKPNKVSTNLRVSDGIRLAGDTQQLSIPTFPTPTDKPSGKLYIPEYANVASRLVAAGFTQEDLAWGFSVAKSTIATWKRNYPEFKRAVSEGKAGQRKRLVAKSFMAAAGYRFETSKIKTIYDKEGNVLKTEKTVFENEQPPNHNLIMWVLTNISRQLGDDEWLTKHTMDLNSKKVVVHIDGKEEFDRISGFAGKYFAETPEERLQKRKEISATFEIKDAVKNS